MASAQPITADEYLRMTFEYAAEFTDGRVVMRPEPSYDHAVLQGFLARELDGLCRVSLTMQTRIGRSRIPGAEGAIPRAGL